MIRTRSTIGFRHVLPLSQKTKPRRLTGAVLEETNEANGYAAGRSSVIPAFESDFAGSGTANKITIMTTNAPSDIKLSTVVVLL